MKEEEVRPGYMSPLVKQDLAKLEKDGDSRRVALHALKQIVENMEPTSVPRFLAQVSESKDAGGSRSYAISLYEEVARVHGKTIIPMIGRVMRTMTGALSGNGNSPQLHEACAKVAAALVRYTIDSESSAAEAEDILKDVSRPLVDLLTGKLEHVAAGAATCMQALVESEKWKHAPADLVSEVCHRTTTALGDKSFRTVAHMQLARSLATMNPGTLNVYGACLIHAAEEVLSSTTYSWQHRMCAAKMAQAVLAIVDRETLSLEFHSVTQVLENCKHDRMPHVRAAVCEALRAAKMIMTGETIKEEDNGDNMGDPAKEAPHHRRTWSPNNYSPSSQDTYNISSYTPPPAACDSASSDPFSTPHIGSAGRMKRSLLFSSKADTYSVSSVPVPVAALTKDHDAISVKENVDPADLGGSTQDSRGSVSGDYDPAPAFHDKLVGDPGVQQNSLDDREFTPTTVTQDRPNGKVESRFSPFEAQITRSFGEAEGDLMAEDEEILSGGSAELGYCAKNGAGTRGFSRFPSALGQFRQESLTPESMGDSEFVQSNTISYRGANSGYSDANGSALPGQMGYSSNGVAEKVVNVLENKQISHMSSLQGVPVDKPSIHDHNAGISHAQYMKLSNLSSNPEDGFSVLKPRVLITTADFLPYSTPRRLVLSLQSQLSSPGEEVGNEEQIRRISCGAGTRADYNEDAVRRVDDGTGKRIEFNEDADMDVESSSDSGNWSVRDDLLPSDESVTVESSDEGKEERHTNIYETFSRSRKVTGKKNVSPPLQDRGYASDHSRNGDLGSSLPAELTDTRHQTPDANLACSSCTSSQRKRSARKAQEWDLGSEGDDQSLRAARRSMSFEQVETSSHISQGSSRAYTNDFIDEAEVEVKRGWCSSLLLRSASRVTSVAEVILGGSLCLVIAVPLSMLLARVLQSPEDSYLVPT